MAHRATCVTIIYLTSEQSPRHYSEAVNQTCITKLGLLPLSDKKYAASK